MTDGRETQGQERYGLPDARVVRRRWPGIVWAVPIAALIVVLYLGLHWFVNRGTEIMVSFPNANGVTPGDTKVVESGVEVGKVTGVRIGRDNRHVDLTLRLDPRVSSALNTSTRFWIIGANPSLSNLESVKAAIAGVTIGMEPGTGGRPTHTFTGLTRAPLVPQGARGRVYTLLAKSLGSIVRGASIRYRGLEIGRVTGTEFDGLQRFRIAIWINAPYDHVVRTGSQFWAASPLRVKFTGGGLSAQLGPASSFLQGAVQFDVPDDSLHHPEARPGSTFTLYDDQATAQQGATGPLALYTLEIDGAAGDLDQGDPVSLLNFQVGEVRAAKLLFRPVGGAPYTRAVIALYPRKLGVDLDDGAPEAAWRGAADAAVNRLLAQGYRATLTQSPPIVGAHAIALARRSGTGPAALRQGPWRFPEIPVAGAGQGPDVSDILAKVDAIMTKINRLPLGEIGENVRRLTGNVSRITATVEPRVGPLVDKLDATATELDATAVAARATLSGEGANQGASLPDTLRQLGEAARSIRSLTDYLDRHPEALLRGKPKPAKEKRP